MSGEQDPRYQALQIEMCTPNLIVKRTIEQEANFELTSRTFMGYVNLTWANSNATIFQISVGGRVRNP